MLAYDERQHYVKKSQKRWRWTEPRIYGLIGGPEISRKTREIISFYIDHWHLCHAGPARAQADEQSDQVVLQAKKKQGYTFVTPANLIKLLLSRC
jgi:hypothetical protein